MTEVEWVELMAKRVRPQLARRGKSLEVRTGLRLAYGYEISTYGDPPVSRKTEFQTDLAIVEVDANGDWRPRVIVEAKITSVTTHDAITYSTKAAAHRAVHPYLRYGVMLGNQRSSPLPGRLYRHGVQFDFMISFRRFSPTEEELATFIKLLRSEVKASKTLERILYESRRQDRQRYTVLHRRLDLA